jgi:hypothetical protein
VIAGCGEGSTSPEAAEATKTAGTAHRGLPQGSEPAKLDPTDFTTDIDNPY